MKAIRNATKKIVAVATSATLVSTMAFGSLGSYPQNFVNDEGTFNGNVIVGENAQPMDTSSAMAVIDSLRQEFQGEQQRVRVSYRDADTETTEIDAVSSNSQLNYGEVFGSNSVSDTLDDNDIDFLADGTFDNGASDEDYTQEIEFSNGQFNYALRDEVDDVTEITDGIFYNSGDTFLTYTLEFDSTIETNNESLDDDFIGESLNIMGVDFVVSDVDTDSNGAIDTLELLGGSQTVSLGEGENNSISGNDVRVRSVSDDKVLMDVNGESGSVDLYDSEEIGGVTVSVTDLVSSSRDSVKGYASLVLGGQKVTMEDESEVQVNDEDVSDLGDEDYRVETDFSEGNGFRTITVTYKTDDDVLLQQGESLADPLFNAFELRYDGLNDVDYSDVSFTSGDDTVSVSGTLVNGEDLDRDLLYYDESSVYLRGESDGDRILHQDSDISFGLPKGFSYLITDSVNQQQVWGTGVQSLNGSLDVVASHSGEKTTFTATAPSDYAEDDTFTFALDRDVDDIADFQIQWEDGEGWEYQSANNTGWSGDWDSVPSQYDLTKDGRTHTLTVPSDELGSKYKIGIDSNGQPSGNGGQTFYSTDPAKLWYNGTDYHSSDNYVEHDLSGADKVTFNVGDNDIEGSGFFVYDDDEEQFLYEISNTDDSDNEFDLDEVLEGTEETELSALDFLGDLEGELSGDANESSGKVMLDLNSLGQPTLAFENEFMLDLSNVEDRDGLTDSMLSFSYDQDDVDEDSSGDASEQVPLSLDWDSSDDEIDLIFNGNSDIVNPDGLADVGTDDDDTRQYVTAYGTMYEFDEDENTFLNIRVPDEQVSGSVSLVSGNAGEVMSTVVSGSNLEATKEDLESQGYEIVDTEVISSEDVSFDIDSPMLDSEVDMVEDAIVVGGPAVNSVARDLLDIQQYSYEDADVNPGEGVIRYFENSNSVLVYGYSGEDTAEAVSRLNQGGFGGDQVRVD